MKPYITALRIYVACWLHTLALAVQPRRRRVIERMKGGAS